MAKSTSIGSTPVHEGNIMQSWNMRAFHTKQIRKQLTRRRRRRRTKSCISALCAVAKVTAHFAGTVNTDHEFGRLPTSRIPRSATSLHRPQRKSVLFRVGLGPQPRVDLPTSANQNFFKWSPEVSVVFGVNDRIQKAVHVP